MLFEFCYLLPLTCGLSIWQGSFSYEKVTTYFGNVLVLHESLIGYNISSKCDKDSLMFQNPFLTSSLLILAV